MALKNWVRSHGRKHKLMPIFTALGLVTWLLELANHRMHFTTLFISLPDSPTRMVSMHSYIIESSSRPTELHISWGKPLQAWLMSARPPLCFKPAAPWKRLRNYENKQNISVSQLMSVYVQCILQAEGSFLLSDTSIIEFCPSSQMY